MPDPTIHPLPENEPAVSTPPTLAETGPTEHGAPISMADEFRTRARIARDQHDRQPPSPGPPANNPP